MTPIHRNSKLGCQNQNEIVTINAFWLVSELDRDFGWLQP